MENTDNQKKEKTNINKKIYIICGILIGGMILLLAIGFVGDYIKKSRKTTLPNLVNMTYKEAKEETKKLGLNLEITRGTENNDSIVTYQTPAPYVKNSTIEKGSTIKVTVLTQEEKEKQDKKDEEDKKKENAKNKAISEFASKVRQANNGSLKYDSNSLYKVTNDGTAVYKVKYTTSNESVYYYQLVSLDKDNTAVTKSSKVYEYLTVGDYTSGDTYAIEYEYETLWGK